MIQWYCLDNRNRSANVFFYCTSAPAMRAPTAYPLEAVTPLAQEDTSSSVGCLGNIRREQEALLHFIPRSVPMNDQSFIAELKDLLQRNPPLNKVDRDIAIDMIKAALNRSTLWASGPCIQCLAPIEYGPPSKPHKSQGNDWLSKVAQKLANGTELTSYKVENIQPYLCAECRAVLEETLIKAEVAKEREQIARRVKAYETREGIVRGDIKATPAKRYWALVELIRNEDEDHDSVLRAMPYRDFLSSIYWGIIRDYALYRAKYSCALCHKTHGLQVHHRTYEHRGSEYNHLEDLIVLCGNCHAKFHDKLPAGE